MTEESQNQTTEQSPDEETGVKEQGVLVVFRFILIPLILVGVVVTVIVLFGQAALKQKSVKDYLYDIRTGSQSERWQAAYHLSNLLASSNKEHVEEARRMLPDIILIFEKQGPSDPQIRRYLAVTMGLLQDPRAIPPLVKSLDDEDSQTVIFSLYSIGNIGDKQPVPQVIERLESTDPAIRMMSAYVLGALGDERAVAPLQGALSDESEEVTWNAAMALARMHNPAGAGVLMKLMSRDYLAGFPTLTEPRKEELILNAITASRKLTDPQLDAQVRALSTSDSSLKVRDAAIKALQ